jgi:hypothetical protein
MGRFFGSFFGQKGQLTKPSATTESSMLLRASLVQEWNNLKNEYDRLFDQNYTFGWATRLVEVSDRMHVIEKACVASHIIRRTPIVPEEALQEWQGRSMVSALNTDFDDIALTGLSAKCVKQFNADYPLLAKQFLEYCGAEMAQLSEPEANTVRARVSELIWHFLIAYYQIGVTRALGKPHNVFVSANIRNVFVGLRYKNLLQQGYQDPGREWVEKAVANFVEGHKRNITFYFDGTDSFLDKVYTLTAASASFTDEMGEKLDQILAAFVTSNEQIFKPMLDGL